MTTRFTLTTASALALALFASVPAMADCRSVMVTEVYGNDGDYDAHARDGAYVGVYARGDRHQVYGTAAGCGSRVVTGSFGYGTRTRFDMRGFDNMVGIETRSGGRINLVGRGDGNEIAMRAANGSTVDAEIYGSGNCFRGWAW
jgi:hypothetical protein